VATHAQEIELKLVCSENYDEAVLIGTLKEMGTLEEKTLVQVEDTYWETRDSSMGKLGLSGRLRRKAGKKSLQVKPIILIPELLFGRREFDLTLARGAKPDKELKRLVEENLPVKVRGLPVPQVILNNSRRKFIFKGEGFSAELSLDQVRVRRPGQRSAARFSEVELELLDGNADGLALVAKKLASLAGVSLSAKSKHLRALEAVGLKPFKPATALPTFNPLVVSDEVARGIFSALFATMRGYEGGTRVGLDPEYLHKMRVATRRMRAALRTFEGTFDARASEYLNSNLRWIAATLGEVRDLDVQLMEMTHWKGAVGPTVESGWEQLQKTLERRWLAARCRMLEALDSDRYKRFCEKAPEIFKKAAPRRRQGHSGQFPVARMATEKIGRSVRRVNKAVVACRGEHGAEATHRLRIRGKRLRYTCEFFRFLYSADFKKRAGRLAEFQDVLGEFQDMVVVGELAQQLLAQPEDGEPAAYHYVLGQLVTWSELGARAADARVTSAYDALGGKKFLKSLLNEPERLLSALGKHGQGVELDG
jgi:triphosphatase